MQTRQELKLWQLIYMLGSIYSIGGSIYSIGFYVLLVVVISWWTVQWMRGVIQDNELLRFGVSRFSDYAVHTSLFGRHKNDTLTSAAVIVIFLWADISVDILAWFLTDTITILLLFIIIIIIIIIILNRK
jgi:hypothetical protein